MKLTLAALLAAALAASATPAAACGFFNCVNAALASDSYPPGETLLPPNVQAQVDARDGRGLSLAGFYNDPSVSWAPRDYAPPLYVETPAPAPDYVEAPGPEPMLEGPFRHHRGPHIIMSPYGRRWARAAERHRHVY
jgi:hypothetical protein